MSDHVEKKDSTIFRSTVGLLCIIGSLMGFGGLYFIEIPAGNRDAMMLALGFIFGWGSAVVQSEYGSTSTGRKIADSAVRQSERLAVAAAAAALPENGTFDVNVKNKPDEAIPVSDKSEDPKRKER